MNEGRRIVDGLETWARDCPHCRERTESGDAADWLGLLRHVPVPEKTLEEVSASVALALRREDRSRLATARAVGRLPRPVAWAAALVGAALLAAAVYRFPAGRGGRPAEVPAGKAPGTAAARARVEVLAPLGASPAVDLTVGDTQVVMVFSEELEL